MARTISCRRIFLASPGGLAAERQACRDAVLRRNQRGPIDAAVYLHLDAWEDVAGGVGRPQEIINRQLDESDFAVFVFGEYWGSPPASDGPYTSGTEEEFFRAISNLADEQAAIRDILLLFKVIPYDRLRDPGKSLQKVIEFRSRIEHSKGILFETFDSLDALQESLNRKLGEWSKRLLPKKPVLIELPKSISSPPNTEHLTVAQLLSDARENAATGLLLQAEIAYSKATQDNDASVLLEFAQFMRRTGRISEALRINNAVLANVAALPPSPDRSAEKVKALSNIGVIERKMNQLLKSEQHLREACLTAQCAGDFPVVEFCYALDNYALTLVRRVKFEQAVAQFRKSLDLRLIDADPAELCQSYLNIGRLHLSQLSYEEASTHLLLASESANKCPELAPQLSANLNTAQAELSIRTGELTSAEGFISLATELNEQTQNLDGLSICAALEARRHLKLHDSDRATVPIQTVAAILVETANPQAALVLAWLRGEQAFLSGDLDDADQYLGEAERLLIDVPDPLLTVDIRQSREALNARKQSQHPAGSEISRTPYQPISD